MGKFDAPVDSPFQISTEGEQIRLKFERTGATTGLITWNLPESVFGCDEDNRDEVAYNGIVVTIDTTHITVEKRPTNGTVYQDDPTADTNLHSGDKIGTSLVIGAFYDDRQTTSLEITGLKPNTPYYVQAFAVDKQYRYHTKGVHAYSLDFGKEDETDKPATQVIKLGDSGVLSTDGTGLTPGQLYSFTLTVNGTDYNIVFDGINAGTYSSLVDTINQKLSQAENPLTSPVPLNTGKFYWDGTSLYKWDGSKNIEQEVYIEATDPSVVTPNTYWYKPSVDVLYTGAGSPISWSSVNVIKYDQDPTNLQGKNYWFNGTKGYEWNGSVWCETKTYIQANDPSKATEPEIGTYWFSTNDDTLYVWNVETKVWDETFAIMWDVDPNNLINGTFWFDITNKKLKQLNVGSPTTWDVVKAFIRKTKPSNPAPNSYWYNPETEILQQWVTTGSPTGWVELDVLVWPDDPMDRESCDLWWNTVSDQLNVWDPTTLTWDTVQPNKFIQQSIDPASAPEIEVGSTWFTNQMLYKWDGTVWQKTSFVNFTNDPTEPQIDDVWYNTKQLEYSVWDGSTWNLINPIESEEDPLTVPNGYLWFDTSSNGLFERSGTSWVAVPYVTTSPEPAVGTLWYDTTNQILMKWNGVAWVSADPIAIVELNSDGNLIFSTRKLGSYAKIDFTDKNLFDALTVAASKGVSYNGSDGVGGVPTYIELGVGDDGSADERRRLAHQLRVWLGYPVVDVELTPEQIDQAITIAVESLRRRAGFAYRRGFFFLDLVTDRQQYLLTNKEAGYHKIVDVNKIQRFTSAFLSTAHGAGVYGQIVLQHLYNMGTYDLTSYYLVSQYVEQLEHLFATRVVFNWYEPQRTLLIHQAITRPERVLMDTSIERPEQEFFTDRWIRRWIERYALAQCRYMLAEIRGKYGSLPGAGGGVTLNAQDLIYRAESEMQQCEDELDNYIVDRPEEFGIDSQFILG